VGRPRRGRRRVLIAIDSARPSVLAVFASPVFGQAEADDKNLAKTAQNPVGDLNSLPFQNNMNFDVGPDERTQNVLNIQSVWPIKLSANWNLITRTNLPVISQPAPGDDRTDGVGDLNWTGFFSPRKPAKVIWGAGPAIVFPTASDDVLGTEW
jgi:hypothetical protein